MREYSAHAAHKRSAVLEKPLGSWLWLAFVGGALALVLAAASWLQVPEENNETAVFYGTAARRGLVGGLIVLSFTVDVVAPSRRNEVLKNVRCACHFKPFKICASFRSIPRRTR